MIYDGIAIQKKKKTNGRRIGASSPKTRTGFLRPWRRGVMDRVGPIPTPLDEYGAVPDKFIGYDRKRNCVVWCDKDGNIINKSDYEAIDDAGLKKLNRRNTEALIRWAKEALQFQL